MRKLIFIFLIAICNISFAQIRYVATDGSDSGAGTIGDPYLTWQKGIDETEAGDTLYIRGGVYMSYAIVKIDTTAGYGHSGRINKQILIAGYPADIAVDSWPILDCKLHCDSIPDPGWNIYNAGIYLNEVEYITLKCLEIRNVFQCDSVLNGAITGLNTKCVTFERLRVHDVGQRGFWVQSGAWSYADSAHAVDNYGVSPSAATPIFSQPDTTQWINCDVWNCMDTLRTLPNQGNGGDAWKTISYNGNYQYFEGCRAWNYSDDGYDPNNGKRKFKDCWAMASNKYAGFAGFEGNGFKTSSLRLDVLAFYTPADSAQIVNDSMVITENCLSLYGGEVGFYHGLESDSTDNARWYNNTAYKNGIGFSSRKYDDAAIGDIFRNNISYESTSLNGSGDPYNVASYCLYEESNNSWVGLTGYPWEQDNPAFTITDADFQTVDSAALVALFIAPRQADGSLPTNRPMMLASTSDLIDGGIDVGLPYNGTTPDLGYSE